MIPCNAGLLGCPPAGLCPHEKTSYECPSCQGYMIKVKDTGHMFCNGRANGFLCEYEGNEKDQAFMDKLIGPNPKLDLLQDPEAKRIFKTWLPKGTKLKTTRSKDENQQTILETTLIVGMDTVFCGALVEVQATYTWRHPDTDEGRDNHKQQFAFLMGVARGDLAKFCQFGKQS